VIAIKGLGGYHLAVLAGHEPAAAALRGRKHLADKPFAVMVSDVDAAGELCRVDPAGAALLVSRRRPIVLLPRRTDAPIAPSVAPGNRELGLMLPYTPLYHPLLAATGAPIVLTSGNVSDEPIAYTDADASTRLAGITDAFLTHNRPIHIRTDDSVVRSLFGRPSVLRRSRGYAPEPIGLPWLARRPVLACGAELKNTFCLAKGRHAFVSHHIGDLENYETMRAFTDGIAHFARLFDITPRLVTHDLHPGYLSTQHAKRMPDVELVGVQHRHAHIVSYLADNGAAGPVIGVAFDGTGHGTVWGGGRRLPRPRLRRQATGGPGRPASQRGPLGGRGRARAAPDQLAGHLQRRPTVRRGVRAARPARHRHLRGPGRDRVGTAHRPDRTGGLSRADLGHWWYPAATWCTRRRRTCWPASTRQ